MLVFVYAYTLSFVGAQDRQVVVEAAPLAMEVNHVRCMILPTIFPTNISTSCVSFKDWYEKVDLQYGSLRATINTADIVILPLMATPSLPPYKGQPILEHPNLVYFDDQFRRDTCWFSECNHFALVKKSDFPKRGPS